MSYYPVGGESVPPGLYLWFNDYMYLAIFMAAAAEGLGLPVPAEALFLAAAVPIQQGEASLTGIILAASLGNLGGALIGFALAYRGGSGLLTRVVRMVGLREESFRRVESLFHRYGALTIIFARFSGMLRAPAIFVAGAAQISPWRFAVYFFGAALLWNGAWARLALHFGKRLPELVHRVVSLGAIWSVAIILVVLSSRLLIRWYRRRNPIGS
jgi:membrane protein DedA with SNARE-associated domain